MKKLGAVMAAAMAAMSGWLLAGLGGATPVAHAAVPTASATPSFAQHYTLTGLPCDLGTMKAVFNETVTDVPPVTPTHTIARTTGTVSVTGSNGRHEVFVEDYTHDFSALGGTFATGTSMFSTSDWHSGLIYTIDGYITLGPTHAVENVDGDVTDVCHSLGLGSF